MSSTPLNNSIAVYGFGANINDIAVFGYRIADIPIPALIYDFILKIRLFFNKDLIIPLNVGC